MLILVTGATGFVGRALVLRLLRDGHRVRALVRSPARARDVLGAEVELAPAREGLGRAVEGCDAVVNLAGESVARGRWTAARKRVLWDSRVTLTEELVAAIGAATRRPQALVSASAVGYYGDRGDEELDESSAPGRDFLAKMCVAWEEAAQRAQAAGLRVCCVRIGLVIGHGGGVLQAMLPVIRAGLGGPFGSGKQWFPWVHLHDLVDLLAAAVADARYTGAVLGAAPDPVTNLGFTRALARAVGRRALLPVPRLALRLALGEAASALLAGQLVRPVRTLGLGFDFEFPTLDAALSDLFGGQDEPSFAPAGALPQSPYLARRGATTVMRQSTTVARPIEEVFAFFSRVENLGALTPADATMTIEGEPPAALAAGQQVVHALRVGPARLRWVAEFEAWEPPRRFVDVQLRGPFASWWHEHAFVPQDDGTVRIDDTACYRAPLGPLGRLVDRLVVRPRLRAVFRFRAHALRLRFGAPAVTATGR